jgi:hypothetical protein
LQVGIAFSHQVEYISHNKRGYGYGKSLQSEKMYGVIVMSTKTLSTKKWKQIKFKRVGIAGLKKELAGFEKKYGMPTQLFLQKVERGELAESNDFIDWLGLAEIYQHIQQEKTSDV